MKKTCAIVLNYNDVSSVFKCVEALMTTSIDHIVIVDNHSTDDSFERLLVYQDYKNITLVLSKANNGYGSGNNLGMKTAQEIDDFSAYWIVNPDVILNDEAVRVCQKVLFESKHVKCVAPRVIDHSNITKYQGWPLKTYWREVHHMFVLLKKFLPIDPLLNQKEPYNYVDCCSGACVLFDREAIESVDYFDERIFLFYEENVIGFKFKQRQYQTVIVNKVTYEHYHSVSIRKTFKSMRKIARIAHQSRDVYMKYYVQPSLLKWWLYQALKPLAWCDNQLVFLKGWLKR